MFLLIFESIGTSELILIGIIALMFLGPRKLPQIAKTIGKTLADFRSTTNEFKSTWEREVNFEAEEKALRLGELLEDDDKPVERVNSILETNSEDRSNGEIAEPEIKQIDKESFDAAANQSQNAHTAVEPDDPSDKRNWL